MSIKRLAFLTVVITFGSIVFGSYVASSQSGLGCGTEWPLCNGEVIPTLQGETLIAFTHRIIEAVLGILTVFLFVKVVRAMVRPSVRRAAYWMVALLFLQVLLGALVVWFDLPTFVIAGHLLIAMFFLACVLFIWRRSIEGEKVRFNRVPLSNYQQRKIKIHINVFLGLVILILFVGAYVKHDLIGTSCEWLTCGESTLPTTGPEMIQTTHRILGFVITIYSMLLTYWSYAKKWGTQLQKRFTLVFITVATQVVMGILTIVTNIDIEWAMLHVGVGTLLFAFIVEAQLFMGTTIMNKAKLHTLSDAHRSSKTKLKNKYSGVKKLSGNNKMN